MDILNPRLENPFRLTEISIWQGMCRDLLRL